MRCHSFVRVGVFTVLMAGALSVHAAVSVVRVASGLEQPVYVTAPPDDPSRLFIVEANSGGSPTGPMIAQIKILNLTGPAAGTVNPVPFLEIGGIPQAEDQGLFNLVFHPNYAENGFFYVTYAFGFGAPGESRVERYKVSDADPDLADPGSATVILKYPKPFFNHNGNWLGFSPTDLADENYYLYHVTGDGGANTDPMELSQDVTQRYGKVLRVDVGADGLADDFPGDTDNNFAIPSNNPDFGVAGADPAVWSLGLRNPWRASFDRWTGDLYIGNVGANLADEVEFQPFGSSGGENYGWSWMEGTGAGPNPVPIPEPVDQLPMYECIHGGDLTACPKRSITGGYVYRGPVLELIGHYVFADFLGDYNFGTQVGGSQLFSIRYDQSPPATFDGSNIVDDSVVNRTAEFSPVTGSIDFVSSFGEDALGNLYIVDMGNLGTPDGLGLGEIYRIEGNGNGLVEGLVIGPGSVLIGWDPTLDADTYDIVRGDLDVLISTAGDFRAALLSCVEPGSFDTTSSDTFDPSAGQGFFYLARAVNATGGGGSYGTNGVGQVDSRNAEIFLSGVDCP